MTPSEAAEAAADREQKSFDDWAARVIAGATTRAPSLVEWQLAEHSRDLYVRAFLAGYAQAQKDAIGPVQAPPGFHLEADE